MPRNMSFSLTTQQVRNQTKTVTRRLGWKSLKKGEILNACVKCMGLKKGEKVERISQIKAVDVRFEQLSCIQAEQDGTKLEGFPELSPDAFIDLFCKANQCKPDEVVTRIEYEYCEPMEKETKTAIGEVSLEVWVDCPHCGKYQEQGERLRPELDEGLRADKCEVEVKCQSCREYFFVTKICY